MFLIYGGNGWIGQKIVSILEERKTPFMVSKIRADDIKGVETEINEVKPTNILCLLKRTHGTFEDEYIPTIDYLEKKGKVKENVRDNLFCPVALALLCKKYDIHLTYLGTGCIFTYDDDKRIFTEEDEPNFFGSVLKGYTDRLMFDNVLNVRIRMPISSDTSPRNFIVKLLKYEKICSMHNSMTVLDDLLPIMCDMISNRETGTVNLTNPGTIEHSEILDMYKEIVDPKFEYKLFSYEDQMKVIACDRSNNELSSSLLTSKYRVKNIKDSVRDILNIYRQKVHKNLEGYYYCQNNEFIFLCGKEFETPSDKIITELFITAKESYCEILSPVIVDKSNKILFYGGIICRNKVVMFDESTISFETLNSKNSFNYVRPSMIFYPRYFVIKKTVLNEMNIKNVSEINIVDCINRDIRVTPFIRITQNIYLEHAYKRVEKINIFNFEEDCIKEYMKYNIDRGSFSLRIQNRKFLDNSLKHALVLDRELIRPDNNCGAVYTLNFMKLLMRNGYKVHFMANNCNFEFKYIHDLQKIGIYVAFTNNYNSLKTYLSTNSNVYDLIFTSRLYDTKLIYETIRKHSPKSKLVYITHDLHSLRHKRMNVIASRSTDPNFELEEISYIERCDMSLLVSDYEYTYLRAKNISNIMHFPICYEKNIIDRSEETIGMYFIGSTHDPNVDAINYFLKYIYPQVLRMQKIPLHIFGEVCTRILPELLTPCGDLVKMQEYISETDLKVFLKTVRLNIIPVRFGAGVKGKLLQAANNGVPTITTSIGAEGTCFKDMENIIIMDVEDPGYSFKLIEYYNNREFLQKLSASIKNTFDREYSLDKGDEYMQSLVKKLDNIDVSAPRNRICVLFNTYNKPEIIKLLKAYLQSVSEYYIYEFFLVNNGGLELDYTYNEFNIISGDNSVNEFSGIQKCIDNLDNKAKYSAFIICNDTISLNYPLSPIYNFSEISLDTVCRNRYAKGHRNSFGMTMTLDNFQFDSWYRSFFVLINQKLFNDMGYRFMNYRIEDIYDGNVMKIHIGDELRSRLTQWLSQDIYRNADMRKKYTCIFNEYRFNHEIEKAKTQL